MKKHLYLLAAFAGVALAALLASAGTSPAMAKDAFGLSAMEKARVKGVEKYLNSLTTVSSGFIQATSRGAFAKGDMWLSLPGRMRIDYHPPEQVLIVSDGSTVLFKDEELDQLSYTSLDSTPAGLLLGGKLDFFGPDVIITDYEEDGKTLLVTIRRTDDPMAGSLSITVALEPMRLKRWMVIDTQGIVTTVTLLDPSFGVRLDDKLFKVEQRTLKKRDD